MPSMYGVRLANGSWFNSTIPTRTSERHEWAEILETQNRDLGWER